MIRTNTEYKVRGYRNRWSLIDTFGKYGLLENCTYGDETCYLVVDLSEIPVVLPHKRKDGTYVYLPTILNTICETYDDIETAVEENL